MGCCWTYSCSSKIKLKHFISGTLEKSKHRVPLFGEQLVLLTQNNSSGMKWIVWVLLVCHTHINTRIQVFSEQVSLGEETTDVDRCREKKKKLRLFEIEKKKNRLLEFRGLSFWLFLKTTSEAVVRNTAVVITDKQ